MNYSDNRPAHDREGVVSAGENRPHASRPNADEPHAETPQEARKLARFAMPGDGGQVVVGHPVDMEGEGLREAAGHFPTGVAVMTINDDQGDFGMTLNSFTSVSLNPPMVTLCVSRKARVHSRLKEGMFVGISILGAGQEGIARQFAGPKENRFDGVATQRHRTEDVLLLEGASSWIAGHIIKLVPAGDHTVLVIKVTSTAVDNVEPLLFKAGVMVPWPASAEQS